MPSSQEHKAKAARNRAFLGAIDAAAAPEWMAVVAFYTALHLVERLAACENLHHDGHFERRDYLLRHRQHRAIHRAFSTLHDASQTARYGTVKQFDNAFPGDTVQTRLVDVELRTVTDYVDNFFAAQASGS